MMIGRLFLHMTWKSLCFSVVVCFNFFLLSQPAFTQERKIFGYIQDAHSEERIPFASIQFRNSTIGKLSDSAGNFSFILAKWPSDTIEVTYVGYETFYLAIDTTAEEMQVTVNLERGKRTNEVIVKSKIGRGMILWRKIVKNKPFNDRARFDNFSYELYNKLEADLKDANNNKLIKLTILKPFKKVINQNIDSTTEDKPIRSLYLTNFYQITYLS